MNGPGHYREAEKTLAEALATTDADLCVRLTGIADVHATLALAAAAALHPREALTTAFRDQVAAPWVEVAG